MFFTADAQQNVGIGTNNPETKLQVNGAISLVPVDDAAAASVTIPDNVSVFRLRLSAGGGNTTLSIASPKEGQLLTIFNEDDNAASFVGNTINASTGVSSFVYLNGNWRLTGSNSITGPQGPAGPQGPIGPTGAQGAAGAQGPQGVAGPQGPAGANGAVGAQGPAGPQGPKGDTGAQGAAGAQGPQGVAGPQGPAGANGAAGAQGPAGPQGAVGPQGPKGDTGARGPQGVAGPQGPAGANGAAGPQGVAGPAGAVGPQGPAGSANINGTTNYVVKFTGATTGGNSSIYDNGNVGIGTTSPGALLHVNGSSIIANGNVTHYVAHGNNARQTLPAANNGASSGEANLVWWVSEPGMTWTGAGIARNMYNTTNWPRINTNLSGQMIRFDEGTGIIFTTESSAGARNNPLVLGGNSVTASSLSGSGNVPVYADNNGTLYKGTPVSGGTTIRSVKQTANISTASATFSDMGALTLTFTPTKSTVYVFFSAGVEISTFGMGIGTFRILKDGVSVGATKCLLQDYDEDYYGNVYQVVGGNAAINGIPVAVTPGVATTIKMQWRHSGFVSGTSLWCYPATYPDAHHGVLTIME
ncbi:MAG: collagen-like protein [Bacteroidetes bacterium]|nr:collagen-like protein [Bacteroidota bacterium]